MQRGDGFIVGDHREPGGIFITIYYVFIIYHYKIHYKSMTKFVLRKLIAVMDVIGAHK